MITCSNLYVKYDNVEALSDVSFTVNKGDYLFVVGENGSGKTSLVKALLGLLPLSRGKISFSDNADIGYISQQTPTQNDFPASVFEIVLSGFIKKSRIAYSREQKNEAAEKMKEMGIYELKNKCFRELSGGQKQRVLLVRALCASDRLLVLDEPTAGLDAACARELYSNLHALNKQKKTTIIMVSHDISAAVRYAGRILHIDHGVEFFGSKDEYLASGKINRFS